jgi:hypothetical protein
LYKQNSSKFLPHPLNDVWMASLGKVRVRNAIGSSNGRIMGFLPTPQALDDSLVQGTNSIEDNFHIEKTLGWIAGTVWPSCPQLDHPPAKQRIISTSHLFIIVTPRQEKRRS